MKDPVKEFRDKIKMLFSSLFARRMTFIIIGCPDLANNQFIFSNVPLAEMELYEPKAIYYSHLVTVKDAEFLSELWKYFPVLKDTVLFLNTRAFLSVFNKEKDLNKFKLVVVDNLLRIQIWEKGDAPLVDEECGNVISNHHATLYYDNWKSGLVDAEEPYKTDVDINKLIADVNVCPVPVIDVFNRSFDTLKILLRSHAVVQDGMTFVSLKEAIHENQPHTFTLTSGSNDKAIKAQFDYEDDFVKVTSVQPAARWFCQDKVK